MDRISPTLLVAPSPTWTRSSRVPSPATSPSNSPRSSNWLSTSKPWRLSGWRSHSPCCSGRTKWST